MLHNFLLMFTNVSVFMSLNVCVCFFYISMFYGLKVELKLTCDHNVVDRWRHRWEHNIVYMLIGVNMLTLKVLNFWKFTSCCSLKTLMVRHGGSSAGSYLADHTSPIPSHCASIAATCTLRVKYKKNLEIEYEKAVIMLVMIDLLQKPRWLIGFLPVIVLAKSKVQSYKLCLLQFS